MNRYTCCAVLAALAGSSSAFAVGSIAAVEVIDRDTGTVLSPHYYRGEYWIAGHPGSKYAIRIENRDGGRILAVTSVDGVNVISGEDAAFGQDGYVFDPAQQYEITGWRKTQAEVAAFTFTDAVHSYAELTGRPANVGVIGVALFRERVPPPLTMLTPSPATPAPRAGLPSDAIAGSSAAENAAATARAPPVKLGTGHGERETSLVERVSFERQGPQPNEIIRIRYDSLENLMARGIIHRPIPHPVVPQPDPFPAQPERFVADPPG